MRLPPLSEPQKGFHLAHFEMSKSYNSKKHDNPQ